MPIIATTVTAITAVAAHPEPAQPRPDHEAAHESTREASSIMTAMMGTAMMPLISALQTRARIGSKCVKFSATPPTVAIAMMP